MWRRREGDLFITARGSRISRRPGSGRPPCRKGSRLTSGRDLPDARSDLLPMLTLLQAIRERGTPCHVVYASSRGTLYGTSLPAQRATERSPVVTASSYGRSSLVRATSVLGAGEGWLTLAVLRIGNAYGAPCARPSPSGSFACRRASTEESPAFAPGRDSPEPALDLGSPLAVPSAER